MEANFVNFLDYVPYTEKNKKIYSPKLLAMLLQNCGYIDTVFKEMAKFKEFVSIPECEAINDLESSNYRSYNIGLAREAFQPIYRLSSNNGGKLIAKLDWVGDKKLFPFKQFGQGKSPAWWHIYNEVKHTWSSSLEQANVDNVLRSLAGAFLLNVVHYPSIRLLRKLGVFDTVLRSSSGLDVTYLPDHIFDELLKKASSARKAFDYDHVIESDLFLFVMEKRLRK